MVYLSIQIQGKPRGHCVHQKSKENLMDKLTLTMLDYAKGMYAIAASVATTESLMGGPPSTDLEYVLPGAKSALTFAYALDRGAIERFLAKEDREAHQRDNFLVNAQASVAALWMARYLE